MTVGEAVKVLEMMADENTLLQIDKVKEVLSMVIPSQASQAQASQVNCIKQSSQSPSSKNQTPIAKGFEPIKDSWSPKNI